MTRARLVTMMKGAAGVILAAFSCVYAAQVSAGSFTVRRIGGTGLSMSSPSSDAPQDVLSTSVVDAFCRTGGGCDWSFQVIDAGSCSPSSVILAVGGAANVTCSYTYHPAAGGASSSFSPVFTVSRVATSSCSTAKDIKIGLFTKDDAEAGVTSGCVNSCSAHAKLFMSGTYTSTSGVTNTLPVSAWISDGTACAAPASQPVKTSAGKLVSYAVATDSRGNDLHIAGDSDSPDAVGDDVLGDDPTTPGVVEPTRIDGTSRDSLENAQSGCVTTERGNWICTQAASDQPDNGTAGTLGEHVEATYFDQGSAGGVQNTYNIFSGNAVAASSNHGTGSGEGGDTGGGTGDGTGTCGTDTNCKVKIDETGTQTSVADWTQSADYDGARSQVDAAANAAPVGTLGSDLLQAAGIPQAAACQSLTFDFSLPIVGTKSITFPGSVGCDKIEAFKAIEAWLLSISTAIAIAFMALKESKPS